MTPEYKLANVWLLNYRGLHLNPGSLEKQDITAHGESDIAAVSWGNGNHMRIWYQAPESSNGSNQRCQIKELEHNRNNSDTWKQTFTFGETDKQTWFTPLPGTRLAATNRGAESTPKLVLFAQEGAGGIVHFSSSDTKWAGYDTRIPAGICKLYTPITCVSWHDGERELVNMFYVSDNNHIVDWRCLYKNGNQSRCAHALPHELGPNAEMSLCGVKNLKFIGEPKARLHIVAPIHTVKSLTWKEGWNPSEDEVYEPGGIVNIDEKSPQKAAAGANLFKNLPVMSFKYETRTRCHKRDLICTGKLNK